MAPGVGSILLQVHGVALYDRAIAPDTPGAIEIKRLLERYANA